MPRGPDRQPRKTRRDRKKCIPYLVSQVYQCARVKKKPCTVLPCHLMQLMQKQRHRCAFMPSTVAIDWDSALVRLRDPNGPICEGNLCLIHDRFRGWRREWIDTYSKPENTTTTIVTMRGDRAIKTMLAKRNLCTKRSFTVAQVRAMYESQHGRCAVSDRPLIPCDMYLNVGGRLVRGPFRHGWWRSMYEETFPSTLSGHGEIVAPAPIASADDPESVVVRRSDEEAAGAMLLQ